MAKPGGPRSRKSRTFRLQTALSLSARASEQRLQRQPQPGGAQPLDGTSDGSGPRVRNAEACSAAGAAAEAYRKVARERLAAGDVDGGWSALKAAEREMLWCSTDDELRLESMRVRMEAGEKLTGWRREFVLAALCLEPVVRPDPCPDPERPGGPGDGGGGSSGTGGDRADCADPAAVQECRAVLDEALDNRYFKLTLLGERLSLATANLIVTLVLAVGFWISALLSDIDPLDAGSLFDSWTTICLVGALGALGATLSALFSLKDQDLAARIPDLVETWKVVPLRPLIGAASALLAAIVLQSGVGGLSVESGAVVVAAIGAGFSERIATRAVVSAAERAVPDSSPPSSSKDG